MSNIVNGSEGANGKRLHQGNAQEVEEGLLDIHDP